MPKTVQKEIKSLGLDLKNFRTIPQADEGHAINAMIAINPDWFWPLMESLLDDGYEPTENIIVLHTDGKLVVKEGNRRVAALKLIFSLVGNIEIPQHLRKKIDTLSTEWKAQNAVVPCAIYESTEVVTVEKLVARTHAKGEKAGRDKWNAVAKARFGRDQKGQPEPGLDLLEKFLGNSKNVSLQQAERWAGDYPLTVLDEAIQKLSPHLGYQSAAELASQYPKKHKKLLESVLYDIGIAHLGFKELRDNTVFWAASYGVVTNKNVNLPSTQPSSQGTMNSVASGGQAVSPGVQLSGKNKAAPAFASNDPKSVRKKLKSFHVKGAGRDKLVTLLNEIKKLKHEEHPHAFCFLLRSMFELSAVAYCADHKPHGGPITQKPDGRNKELAVLLREITGHMTGNGKNKEKVKLLHGATTEIGKKDGILSVTSMNQLVHNPSFSIQPPDISIMFGNVFPLLVEMNN
ncbi:MAG: hypothetical protein MCM46_04100 [Candidatus Manganitrophus sp. SB1]|nr:hypothetical protein [Candidatus Manganitrophus morganii]